jgi:hypothetical protein
MKSTGKIGTYSLYLSQLTPYLTSFQKQTGILSLDPDSHYEYNESRPGIATLAYWYRTVPYYGIWDNHAM